MITPMPPVKRFKEDEIVEIVTAFKRMTTAEQIGPMEACRLLGEKYGRNDQVIYRLVRRFVPTTDVATLYLQSNALRLANRVVRKANVDQAIDILSRTNIGVLAPKQEQQGGQGGFFLSVQADTLGAVNVAVLSKAPVSGQAEAKTLPSAPYSGASGTDETGDTAKEIRANNPELSPVFDVIDRVVDDIVDKSSPAIRAALRQVEEGRTSILVPVPSVSEPGVPHPNQGTVMKEPNPTQRKAIESHKKRLAEARKKANVAKISRIAAEVEV